MRLDQEVKKSRYLCNTCGQMFFSLTDVSYHKGMTGHGEYIERKSLAETQTEA